ncbi:MAG: FkbM family methyltransferase [Alphaproteobacteria bacterium]|nr:MAG: FkbM family methyltransferase [Alphaproteobacteria bacterium]
MTPDAIRSVFADIEKAVHASRYDDALAQIESLNAAAGDVIRATPDLDSWLVSAWRLALIESGRYGEAAELFDSRVAEERALIAASTSSLVPILGQAKRVRYADMSFSLFLFRHDILSNRILAGGGWEQGISEYLAQVVRPGDLVIDIGANIGWHTIAAAVRVGPTGRVIAFEPEPVAFRLLVDSVRENGLTWVEASPMAIGAAEEVVSLHRPYVAGNAQHSIVDQGLSGDTVTIAVAPLTAFSDQIDRRIRLLKMDIEGAEVQALIGMEPILSGPYAPEVMIIEFSPRLLALAGAGPEWFDALTTRFGYGYAVLSADTGTQVHLDPGQSLGTLYHRVLAGQTGSDTQFDVVFMR